MGRNKKKPGYDAEKIMKEFIEIGRASCRERV